MEAFHRGRLGGCLLPPVVILVLPGQSDGVAHLPQEGGGLGGSELPVQDAAFRVGQIQLFPGAGHAHVAEPPLLLHLLRVGPGLRGGEEPVLHAAEEHRIEFQALGGVEGHKVHAAVLLVHVVRGREEGHGAEEGLEHVPVGIVEGRFKFAHIAQKLLHVLRTDLVVLLLVLLQVGVVADALQ